MKRLEVLSYLIPLILFIFCSMAIARVQFDNGRIAMCREMGGELAVTVDGDKCISGELADEYLNPPTPTLPDYAFGGQQNGSIL